MLPNFFHTQHLTITRIIYTTNAIEGLSIGFCAKDFEYDNQGVRLLNASLG